jgi:hypothetical protein
MIVEQTNHLKSETYLNALYGNCAQFTGQVSVSRCVQTRRTSQTLPTSTNNGLLMHNKYSSFHTHAHMAVMPTECLARFL